MTNKQQQAIQEMSKKRLLTSEQKKVLYKLFEQKLVKLEQKKTEEQRRQREKAENEALKTPEAKAYQHLVDEYNKLDKRMDEIKEKINKTDGYNFCTGYNSPARLTVAGGHYLLRAEDRKADEAREKTSELKMQLQADIYGLPLEYAEMIEHLEQELAKI